MNIRCRYGLLAAATLVIEVLIALFVRDSFIRPYVGDVLVIFLLYFSVRILIPQKCRLLPLWIFLFAFGVEWLQSINIVALLGLDNIPFFNILVGTVFDWWDVLCYAIGAGLLFLLRGCRHFALT